MAKRSSLEVQLTALTARFVGDLLQLLRRAPVTEVGAYATRHARSTSPRRRAEAKPAATPERPAKPKHDVERRRQLAERVVGVLAKAEAPLGVRAIAAELGIAHDLLATPLRELRREKRIEKQGEKRKTAYRLATSSP